MSILISYPWWFVLLCLLTGFVYAAGLYYKNKKQRELSLFWRRLLAGLRFCTVALLSFFLLSPLVKSLFRTVEKPLIVIARDNSTSILINKDSSFYKSEFPQKLTELGRRLSAEYDVFMYNFSGSVTENEPYDFSGKETDISKALDEINVRYVNRNLGAIILASDGLYNKGMNPLYQFAKPVAPIYTIALGDTTIPRDLLISRTDYNRVVFLGNQFPVEVSVNASKLQGANYKLSISSDGKMLFEKPFTIDRENYSTVVNAVLTADRPGTKKYRVQLSRIEGELTFQNNFQDLYIEVIDSRQKILVLADAPHPDIAAIVQTIGNNKNYQVESFLLDRFNKSLKEYSLVVFYQLPSLMNNASSLIETARSLKLPVLYVLGNSSSVNGFNQLNAGMKLIGNRGNSDGVQAIVNNEFSLFSLNENTRSILSRFPPLSAPYATATEVSSSASVLLYKRVGSVSTKNPLLLFATGDQQKLGVLAAEGIFQWRLAEYALRQNHQGFDELFSKIVQYLAVKEDKSLFRINLANQFMENEPVIIDAELYNESFDLINTPDVKIEIRTDSGQAFPFTFSKTSNAYKLNAGVLPVGEYTFVASVNSNGKVLTKAGAFTVKPIQMEAVNTVADHQLLYSLSKNSGGEMVYPSTMDKLIQLISAKEEIVSKSYAQKQLKDLIEFRWIFFLLLILLSVEWFFRKRNGVY